MSEHQNQNNNIIQEGQTVSEMQKITPTSNLEKGQPVPSMQQKPQNQQPQPSQDQGGEDTDKK